MCVAIFLSVELDMLGKCGDIFLGSIGAVW